MVALVLPKVLLNEFRRNIAPSDNSFSKRNFTYKFTTKSVPVAASNHFNYHLLSRAIQLSR